MLNFAYGSLKAEMKVVEEYCWVITQVVGQSCCGWLTSVGFWISTGLTCIYMYLLLLPLPLALSSPSLLLLLLPVLLFLLLLLLLFHLLLFNPPNPLLLHLLWHFGLLTSPLLGSWDILTLIKVIMWTPHPTPSLEGQGILCFSLSRISLKTCSAWMALPAAKAAASISVKLAGAHEFPHWPNCAFNKVEIPLWEVHIHVCMLRSHLDKTWLSLDHPEHNSFISWGGSVLPTLTLKFSYHLVFNLWLLFIRNTK